MSTISLVRASIDKALARIHFAPTRSLAAFAAVAAGLAVVGAVILAWNAWIGLSGEPAVFRITDPEFARLRGKAFGIAGQHGERLEVVQYGEPEPRASNVTLILAQFPAGHPMAREFAAEFRGQNAFRDTNMSLADPIYRLDTRFGALVAADMRVDLDGHRKMCLAFLSRFETAAVYLKGWYCTPAGTPPSAERLACLLDSFTIDRPLVSPAADEFLRGRAGRPPMCESRALNAYSRPGPRR